MSNPQEKLEAAIESSTNRRVALLIAVLALILAFSEAGGKQSEQASLSANVEASNIWAFFQAKTIRRADAIVAAEAMQVQLAGVTNPELRSAMERQIAAWRANAVRLESEPETNEGRRELMVRARALEATRDTEKARAGWFELSSGALQIGIVLASAAIITGMMPLVLAAAGMGGVAAVLMGFALMAPRAFGLF